MTHVLLLVHPRADNAGFYCAASVLLRTRFLVMGCVKPRGSRPRTKPVSYTPPLLRHSPLSRNLQSLSLTEYLTLRLHLILIKH